MHGVFVGLHYPRSSGLEPSENMVIDKRIKDVAKDILIGQDIVDLDQSDLESMLLAECNKVL